ncbi:MAG: Serine/threonine protein kinase, partial [Acidimicrobiales bacterium]|nr:Serine/threonine protein kinase [Acidimicrobiales bacterium]
MDEVVAGYRLEAPLGRGSGGTVWRARRPGPIARAVALKRVGAGAGPTAIDDLRREAAVLASLDHPHVVAVLEVVADPPGVALVMPLAAGGSLRDLLDDRGTLTPGETVAVLAPVAEALASAHRRGIVHGDVKPANVLFTSDGEPLLSDFGVARFVGPAEPGAPVAGTAGYLDPARRHAPVDARSDVYSLGVVAYEALAGRPPYAGPKAAAVAAADAGIHVPLTSVRSVPGALASVVEAAIDREPLARPSSAADLAAALRGAVDPAEVVLPARVAPVGGRAEEARVTEAFGPQPITAAAPPAGSARRHRCLAFAAIAGAAVVAVVAAASGAAVVRSRHHHRHHDQRRP